MDCLISRTKAELRKRMRSMDTERPGSSDNMAELVLCSAQYKNAKTVFCFVGVEPEPDTMPILRAALMDGKILAVPKCGPNRRMDAKIITDLDQLKPGKFFGILEPPEEAPILSKSQVELVIVPGLCYDRLGYRLGYGGGYYDLYLSDYSGESIGLCFEKRLFEQIPREQMDIPVKQIATEKRIICL